MIQLSTCHLSICVLSADGLTASEQGDGSKIPISHTIYFPFSKNTSEVWFLYLGSFNFIQWLQRHSFIYRPHAHWLFIHFYCLYMHIKQGSVGTLSLVIKVWRWTTKNDCSSVVQYTFDPSKVTRTLCFRSQKGSQPVINIYQRSF